MHFCYTLGFTIKMIKWFAVVEVDKEDIANCTSFDAQIGK